MMWDTAMDFSRLPVDIKLVIFSYFRPKELCKRLARVCREWRTLSKHPSLWKSLKLDVSRVKPLDVYTEVLNRYQRSITSLKVSIDHFRDFVSNFEQDEPWVIKELHLIGIGSLEESYIHTIVSNCPDIEILNLLCSGDPITPNSAKHIGTLTHLRSLEIHFELIEDKVCLEVIAKQCTKLEALTIEVVNCNADEVLALLAEYRRETLKHLSLYVTLLKQEGFTAIASCRNISSLTVNSSRPIDLEHCMVLSEMQKLKWLSLRRVKSIDRKGWVTFFKCPNLSSLRIIELVSWDLDDRGLKRLAATCKNLVALVLKYCRKVGDRGLRAVIDNCPELLYLNVKRPGRVTSGMLTDIPEKLPNLKCLNLYPCLRMDKDDFENFARNNPRIRVLHDPSVEDRRTLKCAYTVDHSLKIEWRPRHL